MYKKETKLDQKIKVERKEKWMKQRVRDREKENEKTRGWRRAKEKKERKKNEHEMGRSFRRPPSHFPFLVGNIDAHI